MADEQRIQAYIQVVQELLSCPNGEEPKVLQQHSDLVDAGLVQVMGAVVEQFRQQEQMREADWLENMAAQLAQVLGMAEAPPVTKSPDSDAINEQQMQAYVQVVQELLSCLNGEEQEVLQRHQDLVDAGLVKVMGQVAVILRQQGQENNANWLENMATHLAQGLGLAGATPNATSRDIQTILQELVQITDQRDVARKVALYQQALGLVSRQSNEQLWASLQVLLGGSLQQNPLSDSGQNLEDAISAYEQALEVFTCDVMPVEWAETINGLANTYIRRFLGDRTQNIESAIAYHKQALQVRTREVMPVEWAESMNNLAVAYADRILGDRGENIEDAITYYKQALQVRTRKSMPLEWTQSMNNLANACLFRIRGDRAQNIEDAIAAYEQSLQVMTRDAMSVEWAQSMMNLATAYVRRIRGDRAQNIEDAIAAYGQSLQVLTRETMPVEWAEAMHSLAYAYHSRILGDRTQNVEKAIAMCQQALEVRTREAMPIQWALSMMNLAEAYTKPIRGDRAQNIEDAISAYEQSLQVLTRETQPIRWANAMSGLAGAYLQCTLGKKAENIENSITAYKQALQIITSDSMPIEWARVMSGLADAYSSRIRGDRAQNIEDAISVCEQALEVRTREAIPNEWALSMADLADAYCKRTCGDRAQNIEQAISAFERVLEVYTRTSFPEEWALVQHNMALAYCKRIQGDRTHNIERATKIFECVLEVQNLEANPRSYRITAHNLADLYATHNDWFKAQEQYKNVITATKIIYQTTLFKRSQETELSEIVDLYRSAAYVYAKVGDLTSAIATIEQGRARSLSETLQRDQANLEAVRQLNPELVDRYQTAANTICQLESTERHTSLDGNYRYRLEDLRNQATQARQALQDCLTEIRQIPGYETFLTLPTFEDIAATLPPNHSIIYLLHNPNVHSSNGGLALMLLGSSAPSHGEKEQPSGLPTSLLKRIGEVDMMADSIEVEHGAINIMPIWLDALTSTEVTFITTNKDNTGWFDVYFDYKLNKVDRAIWLSTLDHITQRLWETVISPIINQLSQAKVCAATLIPTGLLGFLPLHAAWTADPSRPSGRRYACDDFQFTYAPNALALQAAHAIAAGTPATKLLAINEPLPVTANPLPSSSAEAAKAIATFPGKGNWKILEHEAATRTAVLEALPSYSVAHFSCHGSASFLTPTSLDSGLLMANNETLSLRDLLDLKLQGLRLAILSACETGIPSTELPDEVISLPTGLLQAGAAGVISSLWSVDDRSTMLLISKFYELWRIKNQEPSEALRQAQIWLRDSTEAEIAPLLGKRPRNPTNRPFSHPYHWSAFSYTGV